METKRKFANVIVVGGTIASGKSTLIHELSMKKGFIEVPELREGDEVQEIILKKLYEQNRIHSATVQFYFLSNRYHQYKYGSKGLITSILDRGMWEDQFFATLLMANEQKSLKHLLHFLKDNIKKSLKIYGYPKLYIFLKVSWEKFKERIFTRNRSAEIANFSKNEDYFKKLLQIYNDSFENVLKEWDLDFIVIDTNDISIDQVTEKAFQAIEERGI